MAKSDFYLKYWSGSKIYTKELDASDRNEIEGEKGLTDEFLKILDKTFKDTYGSDVTVYYRVIQRSGNKEKEIIKRYAYVLKDGTTALE